MLRHIILLFTTLILTCNISFASQPIDKNNYVNNFIDDMVRQHHFNRKKLTAVFNQITIDDIVIEKMNAPKEKLPWHTYRNFFITDRRINKGVEFWHQHERALSRIEKKYGVPASIIVAILGVETNYGERTGNFPVLQTLATLAFNYPARAKLFKSELEEFLLFTREQHINPLSVKGSRAGAIGMPQFLPSSYRRYAVSYNNKRTVDLSNNSRDVIASVANYLVKKGWQPNQPIASPAKISGKLPAKLKQGLYKPKYSLKKLKQYNVHPTERLSDNPRSMYFQMQNYNKMEHWLGFNNFYVLTRYNINLNYALVVYELSEQIKQKRLAQLKLKQPNSGVSALLTKQLW